MATLDDVGDEPPIENLQAESELARGIQEEIKHKLQTEYSHAGTEETLTSVLPEYIKVLVCNAKPKGQVVDDLQLFLQESAPKFVDWLWQLLADRNPARTHSAFGGAGGGDAMDDDAAKPRRRKGARSDAVRQQRREEHERRKRHREQRGEDYPSSKGIRDALQMAVADGREERRARRRPAEAAAAEQPARRERRHSRREAADPPPAERRRLRARAADPERTARLRSEWEQMREREAKQNRRRDAGAGAADRDLLSPEEAGTRSTTFTITMDNLDPGSVPSIAHYDPVDTADAAPFSTPGLAALAAGLPALGLNAQQAAVLAAAGLFGGKGGGKGKGFAPPGKGKGPVYGRGKGAFAGGGVVFGRGGGSPHMTLDKTVAAGSPDMPAWKKRITAGKGPKGKGGFGHMVWQPGMKATDSAGDDGEKDSAARLAAKLDAPLQPPAGAKHKVWVNPKLAKKEAEAAGGEKMEE